ncbi:MAG: hypothetical protein PHR24_01825 [Oscillospiraceae bacterium]|nr:hypothetical protein [Oscillospiraceae bacterium]
MRGSFSSYKAEEESGLDARRRRQQRCMAENKPQRQDDFYQGLVSYKAFDINKCRMLYMIIINHIMLIKNIAAICINYLH